MGRNRPLSSWRMMLMDSQTKDGRFQYQKNAVLITHFLRQSDIQGQTKLYSSNHLRSI